MGCGRSRSNHVNPQMKPETAEGENQMLVDGLRAALHRHFPPSVSTELVDLTGTTDNTEELRAINSNPNPYVIPTKDLTNLIIKHSLLGRTELKPNPFGKHWVCVFFASKGEKDEKKYYTSSPHSPKESKSGAIIPCHSQEVPHPPHTSDKDLDDHVNQLFKTEEGGDDEFKWNIEGKSDQDFKIYMEHDKTKLYWKYHKVEGKEDKNLLVELTDQGEAIKAKINKT